MKYDVAIFTGWSRMGGSTESYINLTNALNRDGIKTVLVGPHKWHTNRCNGLMLDKKINWKAKNVIWHFLPYMNKTKLFDAKHILSCHETKINHVFEKYKQPIQDEVFDCLHFVSEHQQAYQTKQSDYVSPVESTIIPNLLDPALFKRFQQPKGKIGAVIGSVDRNKNTHVSIQKAIDDGCEKVNIWGSINDEDYWDKEIRPLLYYGDDNCKVSYFGEANDKNRMYCDVTDVYHYSLSESWGYIDAECQFLGINYHSSLENRVELISNSEILKMWRDILR